MILMLLLYLEKCALIKVITCIFLYIFFKFCSPWPPIVFFKGEGRVTYMGTISMHSLI